MPTFKRSAGLVLAAGTLLLLTGCDRVERAKEFADERAALGERAPMQLVSREVSEAIAAKWYPQQLNELAQQNQPIDQDPEQVELANSITRRLVSQAQQMYPHSRQWNWELHVVSTDAVNAWCMAGGKMAMYSGLMEQVRGNPDKIAAVMGHEISHALLEHSRQGMTRDMLLSSGLWIASKGLKIGAVRADKIQEDLRLAFQPLSRQHEREADALGLELMARAGFDPEQGSQVWVDLKHDLNSEGEKRLVAFLSGHPMDDERLATLTALAHKLKARPITAEVSP